MKKRKILSLLLSVALIITIALCFSACGSNSNEEEKATETTVAEETTETSEPLEGTVAEDQDEIASNIEKKAMSIKNESSKKLNSKAKNFYGKWIGVSTKAKEMYGNIELTINEDGTFDANITDEEFSGTWEKEDYGIHFDSELIDGAMYYGENGNMVFDEDDFTITLQQTK